MGQSKALFLSFSEYRNLIYTVYSLKALFLQVLYIFVETDKVQLKFTCGSDGSGKSALFFKNQLFVCIA